MTAKINFNFEIVVDNPDMFPELEARTKDFRPVFEDIVQKWARNNQEKFGAAVGMEESGADVDPSVFWEGLKPSSMKRKRHLGFADQIMVATGALRESLEDEDRFFHAEMPLEAAFGTPQSLEEEMKAVYNFKKRPTIFIGLADQKAIEDDLVNYLSFGANWKELMFARGMSNLKQGQESENLEMEFNDAINSD